MSLLLIEQWDDAALLVTDTLVTDPDRVPAMFRSKVWQLPHLNMAIALTGTSEVGDEWNALITSTAARDIEDVHVFAPSVLREIQANLTRHHGDIGTSTVYHFGFPSGSDELVRYTYRSKKDFEPERHRGYQFGAKPAPQSFQLEWPQTNEEKIQLALQIRDENDRGLTPEPVSIGGELFATMIENWSIRTLRWHRFSDYETVWQAMTRATDQHNAETNGVG